VVGMLSASPGAMGGLRAQSHLAPLLLNCGCWVAPKAFALGKASEAFDADGALLSESARRSVAGVVTQVIGAARALASA
jgi:chromate reductase, NAD(P)H dehydrogenase (quinone)